MNTKGLCNSIVNRARVLDESLAIQSSQVRLVAAEDYLQKVSDHILGKVAKELTDMIDEKSAVVVGTTSGDTWHKDIDEDVDLSDV